MLHARLVQQMWRFPVSAADQIKMEKNWACLWKWNEVFVSQTYIHSRFNRVILVVLSHISETMLQTAAIRQLMLFCALQLKSSNLEAFDLVTDKCLFYLK